MLDAWVEPCSGVGRLGCDSTYLRLQRGDPPSCPCSWYDAPYSYSQRFGEVFVDVHSLWRFIMYPSVLHHVTRLEEGSMCGSLIGLLASETAWRDGGEA